MGHMGTYLGQVPLHVSGLILHGAFWYLVKQSLSDYYGSFMLIRGSAGSFKCKIRWLHISLDLHNHAHNEVASVWLFLGGAGSWHPGISNILLSICVQKIGIFCCKIAEKIKKITGGDQLVSYVPGQSELLFVSCVMYLM